jgi:hypothetical protein
LPLAADGHSTKLFSATVARANGGASRLVVAGFVEDGDRRRARVDAYVEGASG